MHAINLAIGAESAFSLQCKAFVKDYVPQIIKAVKLMPLDKVGRFGGTIGRGLVQCASLARPGVQSGWCGCL